jgi:hypothetical protein
MNGGSLGPAALDASGNAKISLILATVGPYSMTATYGGNANCAGSTSATLYQMVGYSPPTVAAVEITNVDRPVVQAGSGAFSLNVYGYGFVNGSVVQWNGSARTTVFNAFNTSDPNDHYLTATITAADSGTSQTIPITVKNPDGTVSPTFFIAIDTTPSATSPVSITADTLQLQVAHGQSATNTITLTGGSGGGSVQVSCLNLPAGASCSYDSSSKKLTIATSGSTPTGTYQIVVVFTQTQPSAALRHSRILLATFGGLGLPFGLLWLGRRGKKRQIRLVVGLAVLALVAMLAACGGSSGSSTTAVATGAQNQSVTQVSIPVTLQVQ